MPGAMYVSKEEEREERMRQEQKRQNAKKLKNGQNSKPIKLRVDFDHKTDGLATVS